MRAPRSTSTAWVTVLFIGVLWVIASAQAAASIAAELEFKPAQEALVTVSAITPSIIGADGPELTQVEAAQRLGLSGKGITICVIDTGVDIKHPNFGRNCPHGSSCRLAFGFDVESGGDNPTPSDWSNAGGHGTHVSGIALGGFPHKLLDDEGNPLPYQRGVAYGAKLGAIRASTSSSEFPYDYTRQALEKTIEKECDVDNMSLGGFYVMPSKQLNQSISRVLESDIIVTAAQGNDDGANQLGARIFNVASPGAFKAVMSVGHVNNTANPGSVLELDKSIKTNSGKRSRIYANQRADTHSSLCSAGDCDELVDLPKEIILIKMVPNGPVGDDPRNVQCDLETITETKNARAKGQVLLVRVPKACKPLQNSQEIWDLLHTLRPILVLMSLPMEDDSHVGPLYYRNKQTPVLWLRSEDGRALSNALTDNPTSPIRLVRMPSAALIPVPEIYSGQPAATSALGPAYDLDMKPDLSAPGSLYSSLPNGTYQTWPGTSMASPYMAGVVALWKEALRKQGIEQPEEGWIAAANTAFKNTARPIPFKGSEKLAWSPVKVGAGLVQAFNAIINKVSVSPTELLVRTDVTTQRFNLVIKNGGDADVTYKLSHRPAVSVSLAKSWYGDGFDNKLPLAQVSVMKKSITVPAGEEVNMDVKIDIPPALRETDCIFGGYITLTPSSSVGYRSVGTARIGSSRLSPMGAEEPVPLSIPYQGSSKDYSTLDNEDSLILFVPPLHDLDAESAHALAEKPSIFLCDMDASGKCNYNKATVKASNSGQKGLKFASTLLRPVQDVKIQVWSADGKTHLGTSPSQGPGGTAPPLKRTYLTANGWDGTYYPTSSHASTNSDGLAMLASGKTYVLKVELHPVLAAGDRLANREVSGDPMLYEIDSPLHITGPGWDTDGSSGKPSKSRGDGSRKSRASTRRHHNHRANYQQETAEPETVVQTSKTLLRPDVSHMLVSDRKPDYIALDL